MRAPDSSEPLSAADTAWLRMEHAESPMTITGVISFARPFPLEEFRAVIERRFLRTPRFRQRIVEPALGLGRPRWEDDPHFDIRAHVHEVTLPPPGGEEALRELLSDLMSQRIDLARAPWHIHLVESYPPGSLAICRLHHCMADGFALLRHFVAISDDPAAAAASLPGPGRAVSSRGARRLLDLTLAPRRAIRAAGEVASRMAALGKLALMPPDVQGPLRAPLGPVKRAAWTRALPFAGVKATARALGATVNDILAAAIAGALRRWGEALLGPGALERGGIRAIVPVNLRPPADPSVTGNRFGLVFLSLPVEVADPLLRLREARRRMNVIKATPEALVAFAVLEAMGLAPRAVEDRGVRFFGAKASLVLTNVPGPRARLSLAGREIADAFFFVPQSDGIGLGVSILSYAGAVRLAVQADANLVPDPQDLARALEDELEALRERAEAGRPAAFPAAARGAATPAEEEKGGGSPMARIERSILIDAPLEDVFEYATTISRFPEWWPSLVEVRNATHEQAATGATYEWKYRMMGAVFEGKDEFYEVVPFERWRNGSRAGELPHTFEHRLAVEDGRTRYTLKIEYTPPAGLLGKVADRLVLARLNEREAERVVASLKAICESAARGARRAAERRPPQPPEKIGG